MCYHKRHKIGGALDTNKALSTESTAATSTPAEARSARSGAIWAGSLTILYVVLRFAIPHIVVRSVFWSTLVATIVFMALCLAIIYQWCRVAAGWRFEVAGCVVVVLGFVLLDSLKCDVLAETLLMLAAVLFGRLVSRLVQHPNMVLPVTVVAGLVDIWGVNLGGPVSQMAAHAPKLFDKLTAKIPHFSAGVAGAPKFISVIGVGDYAFLAIFFACLFKFGMNARGSAWLAGVLVCVGMLMVTLSKFALALPGLPFMAIGIVLPNWKYFQFTREEKFAMLWAGVALAVLLGVIYFAMHAMVPAPASHPR